MKKTIGALFAASALVICTGGFANDMQATDTNNLTLDSSSKDLVDAFNWAKPMALSKVQTGKDNYIPSYQCALQDRPAFCMRDWSHQADGAHLLGLDNENYNMLMAFAKLQTPERKWYSIWEVKYDGITPLPSDYKNDNYFWRNFAGMFEVVEQGYRQYQWTADTNYLNDSTLNDFYTHTLVDFIALHDRNGNDIAEEYSNNGWEGACSYNELPGITLMEAADGLGCQYRAFLAYSKILEAKGDAAGAKNWSDKAAALKNIFNSSWYSATDNRFIDGKMYSADETPVTTFGYETSWFIPYKELCEPGIHATDYLDFIYNSFNAKPSTNIEAWTYLPDVFYKWNQNDRALKYLQHIMDSRSTYPEVSFTIISAIATGMMGIQPAAADHKTVTLPRLPSGNPSQIAMVEMKNIPLGKHSISIKHEGNVKSTLTHNAGPSNLIWEAQFPGTYSNLIVNGESSPAATKMVNGTTVSYVTVTVEPGKTTVVDTGVTPPIQAINLVQNPSFEDGTNGWSFASKTGVASNNPYTGKGNAYLDQSNSTNKISQIVTIPEDGDYQLSGFFAAGGKLDKVYNFWFHLTKNTNLSCAAINIEKSNSYNEYSTDSQFLHKDDQVEIFVISDSNAWINVDAIRFEKTN